MAVRLQRRVSLGVMGSGPLEAELKAQAAAIAQHVDLHMIGHVGQADVPDWFARAHVFLFPSSWDPWGVVANEACLSGLPVIISPHAGAAGELICDGVNGYVRALDPSQWVEVATELTSNTALYDRMSQQARSKVMPYSFENAARGIADASRAAIREKRAAR
jgi:glycosyltransferase involved in cell wall biosynthesis